MLVHLINVYQQFYCVQPFMLLYCISSFYHYAFIFIKSPWVLLKAFVNTMYNCNGLRTSGFQVAVIKHLLQKAGLDPGVLLRLKLLYRGVHTGLDLSIFVDLVLWTALNLWKRLQSTIHLSTPDQWLVSATEIVWKKTFRGQTTWWVVVPNDKTCSCL